MVLIINTQSNRFPMTAAQVIEEVNAALVALDPPQSMSFPSPFELPDGYSWVEETFPPEFNRFTHKAVTTAELEGETWVQQWSVVALNPQELTAASDALAAARAEKWEQVKIIRDHKVVNGGTPVVIGETTKWFHSDQTSKIQQLTLTRKADRVSALGGNMNTAFSGSSGLWKTMDGTWVPMTPNLAWAIFDAGELKEGSHYVKAAQLEAAINASSNPDAIDIQSGWPAVFGG